MHSEELAKMREARKPDANEKLRAEAVEKAKVLRAEARAFVHSSPALWEVLQAAVSSPILAPRIASPGVAMDARESALYRAGQASIVHWIRALLKEEENG